MMDTAGIGLEGRGVPAAEGIGVPEAAAGEDMEVAIGRMVFFSRLSAWRLVLRFTYDW